MTLNVDQAHDEIKAERKPYFPFYGDDWGGGTIGFTLEQEGFYLRFVQCQWARKADLPDDIKWLSAALRCDPRTVRRLRQFLLDEGKVFIAENGMLYNPRMRKEIAKVAPRSAEDRPKIGRRSPEDRPKIGRKFAKKSNDFYARVRAPLPEPEPEPEPKKSLHPSSTVAARKDDDSVRAAEIIKLDEHRQPPNPFGVREDQFSRYHALAATWGHRSDAIITVAPLERALSDANMLAGIKPHEAHDHALVLTAIDLSLSELEARRHDAVNANVYRGPVGLAPCANYFHKTLTSKIDGLRFNAAKLEAEARAEMAVQEARLEKRLAAVNPSGWGDLAQQVLGGNHG